MKRFLVALFTLLALSVPLHAQGSLPIALQQVSDQNGKPIVGALLYFYQVGTVATRQDSFQDTALVNPNQWPLPSDAYGRIPMFYVASGSIHVRLTDPSGLVIFDYPNMLVIGPSGGGGGGGAAVDPSTIASTGDVKWRPSAEVLTGWVRMNGNTIGNAVSSATERAQSDTQALFVYLWNTYPGFPVYNSGGTIVTRGASGLADFNGNRQIATIDMRGLAPFGIDTMGTTGAGRLTGALFGPPYGGSSFNPAATGGEASHVLAQAELPAVAPIWTQTGTGTAIFAQTGTGTATFTGTTNQALSVASTAPTALTFGASASGAGAVGTTSQGTLNSSGLFTASGSVTGVTGIAGSVTGVTVAGTISNLGTGASANRMPPFILGTYFIKL